MVRQAGTVTQRKGRLVIVACSRAQAHLAANPNLPPALAAAERYADGLLAASTLHKYRRKVGRVSGDGARYETAALPLAERHATNSAILAATSLGSAGWQPYPHVLHAGVSAGGFSPELARDLPAVLLDLVGNPFRPAPLDPAWLTSTAVALAASIYESRAFRHLPVLADALEEAGCAEAAVLEHLRGGGLHTRGCWAADLVLGKT